MGNKNGKKPKAVVYIEAPKQTKQQQHKVDYDPQTQVCTPFEDDLNFLLNDPMPSMNDSSGVEELQTEHKQSKRVVSDPEVVSAHAPLITRKLRKEIMDLIPDFSSSDGEDVEDILDPTHHNTHHQRATSVMSSFMTSQLQLESYRQSPELYDVESDFSSTDLESIDDYLKLLGSGDSDDNLQEANLYIVSDEEEQIQLDEEFNNVRSGMEELQVDNGARGQKKKTKMFLDEVGTSKNWKKLQEKMALEDNNANNREKKMLLKKSENKKVKSDKSRKPKIPNSDEFIVKSSNPKKDQLRAEPNKDQQMPKLPKKDQPKKYQQKYGQSQSVNPKKVRNNPKDHPTSLNRQSEDHQSKPLNKDHEQKRPHFRNSKFSQPRSQSNTLDDMDVSSIPATTAPATPQPLEKKRKKRPTKKSHSHQERPLRTEQ